MVITHPKPSLIKSRNTYEVNNQGFDSVKVNTMQKAVIENARQKIVLRNLKLKVN
jgi:hypothetical protein